MGAEVPDLMLKWRIKGEGVGEVVELGKGEVVELGKDKGDRDKGQGQGMVLDG